MKNILNKIITISENLTNKFKSFENSIDNNSINEQEFNSINNNISTLNDKYFPELLQEIQMRTSDLEYLFLYYNKNNKKYIFLIYVDTHNLNEQSNYSDAELCISKCVNEDINDYSLNNIIQENYENCFNNTQYIFEDLIPNIKLKIIIDPPSKLSNNVRVISDKSYIYFNDNIVSTFEDIYGEIDPSMSHKFSIDKTITEITLYFYVIANGMSGEK